MQQIIMGVPKKKKNPKQKANNGSVRASLWKVNTFFSGAKLINSVRAKCPLLSLQIRIPAPQSSQLYQAVVGIC